MNNPKKILVTPLNWGLGHATRMIPIIESLLNKQHEVIIGADGAPLELLKNRFPSLKFLETPSVEIRYSKGKLQELKLISQLPAFLKNVKREKKWLEEMYSDQKMDAVISDNRYGMHHNGVFSVIITHQLFPVFPEGMGFIEKRAHKYIAQSIEKFHKCLIPDNLDSNSITGKLTQAKTLPVNASCMGLLSRFYQAELPEKSEKPNDLLVILSGPEPQRSLLEEKLIKQVEKTNLNAVFILGKPGNSLHNNSKENIQFQNHLNDQDFLNLINQSRHIISRAGYSTIMDLIALRRNAVLIPTPGQTEQEYLSNHLKQKHWFHFEKQEDFNLETAIDKIQDLIELPETKHLFKENLEELIFT